MKKTSAIIILFLGGMILFNNQAFSQITWGQEHRAAYVGNNNGSNAGLHIEVGWAKIINGGNITILNFNDFDPWNLPPITLDNVCNYLQSDTLILEEGLTEISFEWGFKGYLLDELVISDSTLTIDYLICDASNDSVIKSSLEAIVGVGELVYDTASGQYIHMFNILGIRFDQFIANAEQKIITKTKFNKTALLANIYPVNYNVGFYTISYEYEDSISYYQYSPFVNNHLPDRIQNVVTGISEPIELPYKIVLQQNWPNPFNSSTIINYSLKEREFILLKIYDPLGREIAELVNEEKPAGDYTISYDASNLSSGIYYYTLSTGKFFQTKKMLLLK